jgi:tetratricopeptide (TPR) repeat protein
MTQKLKTGLLILFATSFTCLTYLNGQAQINTDNQLSNYSIAKGFMQKEFHSRHNVPGWPELRSDWFVRTYDENGYRVFFEISGFDIFNENLILHIKRANFVNKSDGPGSMYVLGNVKYLNINLNDTIELIKTTTDGNSKKKSKNIYAGTYIKYKKYEIDHRGEKNLDYRYKENKNFDEYMVGLLYNHFLALKENVKRSQINSDSILINFGKEFNKNNSPITISEEQRKFIVQANSANNEKDYTKALELYEKALKISPYAYPEAYFNMALISAQTENYNYAIFNMKKYLILVPDAPDVRTAQDKIYEWEMKIEN